MQTISRKNKRQNGEATRISILNAAEELFGEASYSAMGLRDIASRADITLGLLSYHFATKNELFEEVVERRAEKLNSIALDALRQHSSPTLEQVLAALLHPIVLLARDPEWCNYFKIIVRNTDLDLWANVRARLFSPVFREFYMAMRRSLPDIHPCTVERGFAHALAVAGGVIQGQTQNYAMQDDPNLDLESYYHDTLLFMVGGVRALALVALGRNGRSAP